VATPDRPITIKDIARETGFSTAAVSIALRGAPGVGAEARARIREVAEELGYRRHPAFAALGAMAHRHRANREGLPLIYLRQRDHDGHDVYSPRKIEGLELGCRALGYRFEPIILDYDYRRTQFLRMIEARGITGAIIGRVLDLSLLETRVFSNLALVSAGVFHASYGTHSVRASRFQASREVLKQVYQAGYRRILVLHFEHRKAVIDEDRTRFGGFLLAKNELPRVRDGWIRIKAHPRYGVPEAWREVVEREQPDAVIGFQARDYILHCKAGFRDPKKIGFAAVEVPPGMKHRGHLIAGCSNQESELGYVCIEWLDQMIRLGQRGLPETPRSQVFDPGWMEGGTLPGKVRRS